MVRLVFAGRLSMRHSGRNFKGEKSYTRNVALEVRTEIQLLVITFPRKFVDLVQVPASYNNLLWGTPEQVKL